MRVADRPGGGMQVAGTAIIAQALPIFQHLVLVGSRQRPDIRETADKPPEIVHPLRDARLLQYNFGNPDDIRIV